jgi:hypothetical protein
MSETAKRIIFRVRWVKTIKRWQVTQEGTAMFESVNVKTEAISIGANYAKSMLESEGSPSQLVVHNKNGRIAFERTYGNDPRRSKG